MASRYLRATGNWNGAVWASTSGGAAGSAATPTISDDVYISANFTVTLTADADCRYLFHSNGTLTCSSFNMHIVYMYSDENSSTAKTLNMGSGTWTIDYSSMGYSFWIRNLATVSNSQSSTLILNGADDNGYPLAIGNKALNDVIINLTGSGSNPTNITGSPTFRSLIIQSKNSAAHTVNFDNGATITTNKFVAIGSSTSNKLTVKPSSGSSTIALGSGGSSYGQFVDMQVSASGAGVPKYIGANSTQSSGMGWLLQDPPKISTLVDPLTTVPGSNTNWTASGTISQVTTGKSGGGYSFDSSGASLVSADTFDFVDSYFVFQSKLVEGTSFDVTIGDFLYFLESDMFYRARVSSGNLVVEESADGISWDGIDSNAVESVAYRSVRVIFNRGSVFPDSYAVLGDINPSFAPANNANFLQFFYGA